MQFQLFGTGKRQQQELQKSSHHAPPATKQTIELGTIHFVNLTPDGRHGDFHRALRLAKETGKPIFANFVEWSGCKASKIIYMSKNHADRVDF